MKFLIALLLIAPLAALQPSGASAQGVQIATFNLNWGNRRGDQVLEAIAAANADILCLQETTPQSEQFLSERLADRYPEFHAVGHAGKYRAERFVFASKLPPQKLRFHPPVDGLFGFYAPTYRSATRTLTSSMSICRRSSSRAAVDGATRSGRSRQ